MSVYTSKDDSDSIIVVCEDGWSAHSAHLSFWPDNPYPDLFILEFHLVTGGLFDRLKNAIKYILGRESECYDDIVIGVESARQIRNFIDERLTGVK